MERPPLTCELCADPITWKQGGGIDIDPRAAGDREERWRIFDEEHAGQAIRASEIPNIGKAHWRIAHWACSGDDANFYYIDRDRIDTVEKAMGWTAHLSGKTWFRHTDWFATMRRLGYLTDA